MNKQMSLFDKPEKSLRQGRRYVNRKQSNKKSIHIDVQGEAAVKLDIYCRVVNVNLTRYVNDLVEKDMKEKFAVLGNEG